MFPAHLLHSASVPLHLLIPYSSFICAQLCSDVISGIYSNIPSPCSPPASKTAPPPMVNSHSPSLLSFSRVLLIIWHIIELTYLSVVGGFQRLPL